MEGGMLEGGMIDSTVIETIALAGAPRGLQVAVALGGGGRGAGPRGLELLLATLLPGRALVRLPGGRPVVRGTAGLHVSLSHAAGATALAVAPCTVGVDIERVDPALDALAIDADVFGPRDYAFLQRQPQGVRCEQFYRLWTLKEARLKRHGRTLADGPLPEILGEARLPGPRLSGPLGADMSTGWLAVGSERYCVGVCWDAAAAAPDVLASANCW